MKQAELLDQFVLESRECLETIGQKLLQVERDPDNPELLNDLFRSVHTLKGNCGLFEFRTLESVVHAGEDLLDRVRNRSMAYSPALADTLLDAMDYSAGLIDHIERHGHLADADPATAQRHVTALRALLASGAPVGGAASPATAAQAASTPVNAPAAAAWLQALPADAAPGIALRYLPEPECFFKGEDPWRLACTAPGLKVLRVRPQEPWPEGEALQDWDCYRCNLELILLSDAPEPELLAHFRCVPEQIEHRPWPAAAAAAAAPAAPAAGAEESSGPPALQARAGVLWADQVAALAAPGVPAGQARAGIRSLLGLCRALDTPAARAALAAAPADDAPTAAWLAWARAQGPGAAPAADKAPPGDTRTLSDDAGGERQSRVLRVGQEKIDRLMDLIGEMVVAKNSLPYLAERAENVFGQRELSREIKAQYAVINRIADDMQHAIMQVRMLPVGTVFQRFTRLVRDLSRKLGKDVQLVIEGEDTEADKNVIEPLADPLIHILRNSLDHGIESPERRLAAGKPAHGTIRIAARQEGDRVIIEISDDGAGVDAQRVRRKAVERGLIPADRAASLSELEAVQLIFLPGFSTAETISDLSGRGVGMDVVRNAVERIQGSVELLSRAGLGTTLTLSLPLSMAVTHVMLIESAGRRLGVPMDLIVETVRVHADDIHHVKNARTTVLRGRIVPLRPLNEVLALDAEPLRNADGEHVVLVLRLASGTVGLIVDQFHGASDIILKPLEGVLAGLTGFAGTALMGDGSVLMVLNPKELL